MSGPSWAVTAIARRPFLAKSGERLGQVRDVVARLTENAYPRIAGFVVRIGDQQAFVRVQDVSTLDAGGARLAVDRVDLRPFERRPREILLMGDLVGRNVISVGDARLIRVRDVTLRPRSNHLEVTSIVAGRRPVWERVLLRTAGYIEPERLVDWLDIEPLLGHVPTARRRLPFARVARLHPARLADMVEAASPSEGEEILTAVAESRDLQADVFEELDPDFQIAYLHDRSDAEAAEILASMAPDDAADVLLRLGKDRSALILGRLPLPQLRKVRLLLGYNPETAGGLMSPEFLAVSAGATVEQACARVRESTLPARVLDTLYVVDESGRLVGQAPITELLRRGPTEPVAAAADDSVSVEAHADIPEIAIAMTDFNLEALQVVDAEGHILGIIAVDDLLEVMLPVEWRTRVRHYPSGDDRREVAAPE
ncbi:MAG TPA: CBS domain-containing protein [Chloroflexota bacterium]|nr:CBS domain-containing protein [Chloroflexota bacterium]